MANEGNLKKIKTTKEAREKGRAGGKKSGEVRRMRKTLREELLLLLSNNNTQEKISIALIAKAMNGDVKAFETIRDTIGERPKEKIGFELNPKATSVLESINKQIGGKSG